ncbi:nucleoside phosphorylase-I family protein [Stetteria hydrogenophila]
MSQVGVSTGLKDVSLKGANVFITDSRLAYEGLARSIGGVTVGEFEGLPGVKVHVLDANGERFVVILAPPFPAPVFEIASEVIMFGGRRIIAITRGYRVKRSTPPPKIGIVVGSVAIGLDSVSPKLAPEKLPLIADEALVNAITSIDAELSSAGRTTFRGYVLTVDSARLVAGDQAVQEYIKARQVVAVDTVTAPLYALRYIYPGLEPLSIVVLRRHWSQAAEPVESEKESMEENGRLVAERVETAVKLALRAVESLRG